MVHEGRPLYYVPDCASSLERVGQFSPSTQDVGVSSHLPRWASIKSLTVQQESEWEKSSVSDEIQYQDQAIRVDREDLAAVCVIERALLDREGGDSQRVGLERLVKRSSGLSPKASIASVTVVGVVMEGHRRLMHGEGGAGACHGILDDNLDPESDWRLARLACILTVCDVTCHRPSPAWSA